MELETSRRRRSEVAEKIQFLANRVRCSNCNADSGEAIFMVSDELKFRRSFLRAAFRAPMFIQGKHMRINRIQMLENNEVLIRLCLHCGTTRKTGIPNI